MSFENLSEILWSSAASRGIVDLFNHHPPANHTMSALFGDDGSQPDGSAPHNFLVGISIAVGTSFIQSLGLTIQRKSHVINEAIHPKELRRQACQRPLWHLGFHTYILSNLTGTIFSIGYLPVIILAPLGAVTLVFNALFARLLLGDVFSRQSAAGTFLILLGAIMIGLFGVVPEPSHSLKDLIDLWKRPAFIVYFSLIELTVVSLLIGNRIVEQMLKKDAKANLAGASSVHQRTSSGMGRLGVHVNMHHTPRYAKLLGGRSFGKLSPTRIKTMLGISYGCVGGMLSSQALLFAKSAIELLMLTILEGENQFENPLSWFLVVALITAALLQLYYLNKGLRLCDTVLLVPLSFCAYNVSCLFNGLVYYNQWGRLYWWQILLVLFGISQVLVGVLVLAWRPAAGDEFGEDGDDQEEATLLLPNSSRPSTPRHSALFSFKAPSQAGVGGAPQQMHQQDPSLDARNLIQGFEMYDSDEDTTASSRRASDEQQLPPERDLLGPRLIPLDSSDNSDCRTFSEEPSSLSPTNVQPSKTLAFDSKGSQRSK
ncbi:magnesium transporter [Entomortierella parvispora]|uniref:Magnesium transporter n=1 Tax=Entomortierella parvispora TaxID=205924 RepID=A0A9P3LWR4_9FUNG|nr:magnesium transporter [Entomortierella parvispora]